MDSGAHSGVRQPLTAQELLRQVFDGLEPAVATGRDGAQGGAERAAAAGFLRGVGARAGRRAGEAEDPLRELSEGQWGAPSLEELRDARYPA